MKLNIVYRNAMWAKRAQYERDCRDIAGDHGYMDLMIADAWNMNHMWVPRK